MLEKDVVIVGAGPAGLAASIEAASAGAEVLVVDSNISLRFSIICFVCSFIPPSTKLPSLSIPTCEE